MRKFIIFLKLIRPIGWGYLLWRYYLPPWLEKWLEIFNLVYCVMVKRDQILVAYTKDHVRFNTIAYHPPAKTLFVKITSPYHQPTNFLLNWLASQIDIVYEDRPMVCSLRTDQPILKECEHPHFDESWLQEPAIQKIFVLSQWAHPNFKDPHHKIEILRSSPYLSKFQTKLPHHQVTIFLSGAPAACKGADILYQAFENLEPKFAHKCQLFLIMASNYKGKVPFYPVNQACLERTRKAYERSRNKRNVYFGRVYPPLITQYLYQKADIYVLPTRYDSCPFSVVEAMSYGLPVISTDITTLPEMVKSGSNGFLIEVKDFDVQSQEYFDYAVYELEKYLTILIENPSLRLKMGAESRRRVERKFNLEYKRKRLQEVFEEILKHKS